MFDLIAETRAVKSTETTEAGYFLTLAFPRNTEIIKFQAEAITGAKSRYLLKTSAAVSRGDTVLRYDIQGRISLSDYLLRRKLSKQQLLLLLLGYINAIGDLTALFLPDTGLVCDKEFIFINTADNSCAFVYAPIYEAQTGISGLRDFAKSMITADIADADGHYIQSLLGEVTKSPLSYERARQHLEDELALEAAKSSRSAPPKDDRPRSSPKPISKPAPRPAIKPAPKPPARPAPKPAPAPVITKPKVNVVIIAVFIVLQVVFAAAAAWLVLSGAFVMASTGEPDWLRIASAVLAVLGADLFMLFLALRGRAAEYENESPPRPASPPRSVYQEDDDYTDYDTTVDDDATMTEAMQNADAFRPFLEHYNDGEIKKVYIDHSGFLIGRSFANVDYVCPSNLVGRVHAELIIEGYQLFIKDLESKNGTYINGMKHRIQSGLKTQLYSGDMIQLADTRFTVRFYED
ncbi:MAG: FHA domain-containing protein [Clostridiales bacterium]|jgi:hypothetical protein|nr:FHA domain-containing protein [Clostridiales bacterium]